METGMMASKDLAFFQNLEKEGTIFAKITKSRKLDGNGAYFDYSQYIGKTLDASGHPGFGETTIEDLNTAIGYFHYGDQLTIVSFLKLDPEKRSHFSGGENSKKNCYDVNMVYVEDVKSINDPQTVDYIFLNADKRRILDVTTLMIGHIRRWECNEGADYWQKRYDEITGATPAEAPKAEQEEEKKASLLSRISNFLKSNV
jgi:hypothetical protein